MNLNLLLGTAIVLMALGVAFLYLLIGRGGWRVPKDGMEWLGSIVSGGLIVSAALLLVTILQVQAQGEVVQIQGRSQIEDFTLEEPAPNFAFRMIEDDAVAQLDDFKGKVILVNFWATWCAPCLVEIPDLNELYLDYRDEGLVVLTISDEPRELIQAFEERLPMKMVRGYVGDTSVLSGPFVKGLDTRPTTFVIDREGNIRRYLLGNRDYQFWKQAITPYL